MKRAFFTLDVFASKTLEGNPLAVVLDAEDLDTAAMQAIAREFNLSETVFVLPPRDPVNSARIRIFTPGRELPFAGHPTVGAIVLLATHRAPEIVARQDLALVIEEEIGIVHGLARRVGGVLRGSFTLPRLPETAGAPVPVAVLAAALDLREDEIGFDRHGPTRFSAGVPFTLVPVRGLEAIGRAWPDPARWSDEIGSVFLYTRETVDAGRQFHARMFAPDLGMTEDPATGSAVAALAGALMAADDVGDGDHTLVIEQGFEMGRPSLITLGLEVAEGRLASASLGGAAVVVSHGTLDL